MYEIEIYETSSGNRPFEKYIEKLLKQHKVNDYNEILLYIDRLETFGFDINHSFKRDAIKHLKDNIYELRPKTTRVFFFYYINNTFVLLHGYEKKQNKTDSNEINKAIDEMKDFLKRSKK